MRSQYDLIWDTLRVAILFLVSRWFAKMETMAVDVSSQQVRSLILYEANPVESTNDQKVQDMR